MISTFRVLIYASLSMFFLASCADDAKRVERTADKLGEDVKSATKNITWATQPLAVLMNDARSSDENIKNRALSILEGMAGTSLDPANNVPNTIDFNIEMIGFDARKSIMKASVFYVFNKVAESEVIRHSIDKYEIPKLHSTFPDDPISEEANTKIYSEFYAELERREAVYDSNFILNTWPPTINTSEQMDTFLSQAPDDCKGVPVVATGGSGGSVSGETFGGSLNQKGQECREKWFNPAMNERKRLDKLAIRNGLIDEMGLSRELSFDLTFLDAAFALIIIPSEYLEKQDSLQLFVRTSYFPTDIASPKPEDRVFIGETRREATTVPMEELRSNKITFSKSLSGYKEYNWILVPTGFSDRRLRGDNTAD